SCVCFSVRDGVPPSLPPFPARRSPDLADVATGAESTAHTTLGLVVEALGGPPARRTSRNDSRHWIEVCGLSGPDADAIAEEVVRSEEHTSELQSRENLVCRLLLENKKK